MKKTMSLLLAVLMILTLVPTAQALDGPGFIAVQKMELSEDSIILPVNGSTHIDVTLFPSGATDKTIKNYSENPAVATVSFQNIRAMKEGATRVWFTDATGRVRKSVFVVVTKTGSAETHKITVKNGTSSTTVALVGQEFTIKADVAKAGYQFVEWKVKSGDVELKPIKTAEATVMMQGADMTFEAIFKEVAKPVEPQPQPTLPGMQNISRLMGPDRIGTSVAISRSQFPQSAPAVIIVRKDDFPDALSASVLAKVMNAPIFLSNRSGLDIRIVEEIIRLGAKKAVVIGGENGLSTVIESELQSIVPEVKRIAGTSRYETSALVAREIARLNGGVQEAFIASGTSFPDALSISPVASSKVAPILLVAGNEAPASIREVIQELGIRSTTIVGGTGVVTKNVESQLNNVSRRIGGFDRFDTSAQIAREFSGYASEVFVANGRVFADALVAGPYASQKNAPILLIEGFSIPSPIEGFLRNAYVKRANIVGGESVLGKAIEVYLASFLK
ncbi:cell wall-binding repeat-containing protein [Guggenheimella bovis]